MKVLVINGSPKPSGNTALILKEAENILAQADIDVKTVNLGGLDIRGCIACNKCRQTGKCTFNDIVNECAADFENADGLIIASPVYYASANGTLISFLDRLFYSTAFDKTMKVGAAISVARRAGTTATLDELNKYFLISGMPVCPSKYWNCVHGCLPGEAAEDEEGIETIRTMAHNMVFLMQSIKLGKEKYGSPKKHISKKTNFIR